MRTRPCSGSRRAMHKASVLTTQNAICSVDNGCDLILDGFRDFLEEPAGVGSVAVGHEDGGFDFLIQGQEGLGEDLGVGGLEEGFGVAHSLGGVVLLLRHVAPEIRWHLGRHFVMWFRLWNFWR
ncbi:caffeoylshikimate esterase [Pyrus ussuriensis x Pyrus communis]|uniref:Caffeoylshikimate esterase n=1 Tax=Pyrus ussuriensis x Pyrus communis TaxID=2448454 RepID=A0A5N5G7M2_9ROSA|nr:caffeoylshikimate esterase [Pyrus ussuriensis x Pyrus communis]